MIDLRSHQPHIHTIEQNSRYKDTKKNVSGFGFILVINIKF